MGKLFDGLLDGAVQFLVACAAAYGLYLLYIIAYTH